MHQDSPDHTSTPDPTPRHAAPRGDYHAPHLARYGDLGAITRTSKPKDKTDKTSRKTGY